MGIVVILLIDTSAVIINDLIIKRLMSEQNKLILFLVISPVCLLLQYTIIKQVMDSVGRHELLRIPKIKAIYIISLASIFTVAISIGLIIFQTLYYEYYTSRLNIIIISISYGACALIVVWLSLFFLQWFKSNHDLMILLYFASIVLITFNLILSATLADFKATHLPFLIGEYVGGGGDPSEGMYPTLEIVHKISSMISFFSIWITTAFLTKSYRDKLIRSVTYWMILVLPLVYFLTTYLYEYYPFFLINLLSLVSKDTIQLSLILTAYLSFSKPIGGLIFAIAFWKMSREIEL